MAYSAEISKVKNNQHADKVMTNAVRSISELITLTGKIQTDFSDVETTMRSGGGAMIRIRYCPPDFVTSQVTRNNKAYYFVLKRNWRVNSASASDICPINIMGEREEGCPQYEHPYNQQPHLPILGDGSDHKSRQLYTI